MLHYTVNPEIVSALQKGQNKNKISHKNIDFLKQNVKNMSCYMKVKWKNNFLWVQFVVLSCMPIESLWFLILTKVNYVVAVNPSI